MDQRCPDCGNELPENAAECPHCGKRLDDVTVIGRPTEGQPSAPVPSPRKRRTWPYLVPGAALILVGLGMMSFGDDQLATWGGYVLIAGVLLWGVARIFGPR